MPVNIDPEIYKDGFTAKAATKKQCRGLIGAIAGELNPSELAKKYLGWEPDMAQLALYCLRRFGNPDPKDTDKYKAIATWYITTPSKDVVLFVKISGGGWMFGYLITPGLARKITEESRAEIYQWRDKFRKWAADDKGEKLYFLDMPEDGADELWNEWGRKNYPKWDECESVNDLSKFYPELTSSALLSQFHKYNDEKVSLLSKEFEKAHPYPEQYDDWDMEHNGPITLAVNQALLRTIQDLLRPCQVRDWELYATGEEPDIELPVAPSFY